jgi:outer membrane receptor protein involved in Fe transport
MDETHMKKYVLILLLQSIFFFAFSQKSTVIFGIVTDSINNETLTGATVIINDKSGTITDDRGFYSVAASGDKIILSCRFLGFESQTITVDIRGKDSIRVNFLMQQSFTPLGDIVVSAGKYEQKLSDVMVSLEIVKPERVYNTNAVTLESVFRQTPGVDVMEGQPSIRGGSGFSYGAGSRVLVLIDDLPLISADAGDIKWDYLPVDNISQIEIIKGASSVLYGSSALNGVFNIRTAYPTKKPETSINIFSGIYLDPKRKELAWWDRQPLFYGASATHSRKIKNLDLIAGVNLFRDEGYRENDYDNRARINIKLNYRNQKIKGLSYGINMNGMITKMADFLIWMNADSGAYRQNPQAVSELTGSRFNADPYIVYDTKNGSQHSLKTRFFHVNNSFPDVPDKNNRSELLFGEYKFHRKFGQNYDWTSGLSSTWASIYSNLFGNHRSFNSAIFTQFDGNPLKRLNFSVGLRFERYTLDGTVEYSSPEFLNRFIPSFRTGIIPVFRTGINYQLAKYTYMRASFGQGYRFPSIAEKYTRTTVGSLNIFPNDTLKSERGWSAEIGIKQGIRISNWNAYIDLAAFLTEYREMIEFTFGIYKPDSVPFDIMRHVGFKALNVGNARISGIDFSMGGTGNLFGVPLSLLAGYTYILPLDLNIRDSVSVEDKYLKYRNMHSVKGDAESKYKRITLGLTFIYSSRIRNIDAVFLDPLFGEIILPGFPDYWAEHNKGYTVLDGRLMFDITKTVTIAFLVKNIFNKEYMGRPGDIYPPRNLTLKLNVRI